jgi:alpha-pyrone synthase
MSLTVLGPIAVSNPDNSVCQTDAALNTQRLPGLSKPVASRVPAVYKLSGIDRRFTCVPDYVRDPTAEEFEPHTWPISPYSSTGTRNKAYRTYSIPLALKTAASAIELAGVARSTVTHIVVTSCTGFFAPGLDIALAQGLGLAPTVQRTLIGFMGCYAAFNALRVADAFCQSDKNACVLVLSLELCSLHFQVENTLESVAVNSLFADGCASVIVRAVDENDPESKNCLQYERGMTMLDSDSSGMMSWDIGDTGFLMGLSSKVPDVLHDLAPGYLAQLLKPLGIARRDVDYWAIHPGGKRIIESVQTALELTDDDVADSLNILRNYGNMSSPTILFVLQRLQNEHAMALGDRTVAMAFGPGLTIEGCVFKRL